MKIRKLSDENAAGLLVNDPLGAPQGLENVSVNKLMSPATAEMETPT